MEALVVAEAAFLQELGPGVAGPPAAVLHPLATEVVLERDQERLEAVPLLPHQAAQLRSQPRGHPLVGIQIEDPAAGGVLDRQVAGGVEVE